LRLAYAVTPERIESLKLSLAASKAALQLQVDWLACLASLQPARSECATALVGRSPWTARDAPVPLPSPANSASTVAKSNSIPSHDWLPRRL